MSWSTISLLHPPHLLLSRRAACVRVRKGGGEVASVMWCLGVGWLS